MSGTTTVPEESDTEWTKNDTQELLAAMKTSILKKDLKSTYLKALKNVDWKELQKIRTLTELLVEAEDVISNPLINTKIHPDHPKRPTPPNAIFCEENWAPYEEKFNLATVEYKKKKQEFIKQCESSSNKKRKKLSDDSTDKEQTEDAICLPPKPPFNGYNIFCKEQRTHMTGLPNNAYTSVWAQRWRNLTDREREKYSFRCRQMKREYAVKLKEYLKTFDQEMQQKILKGTGIKTPMQKRDVKKVPKKIPGEPKKPSNANIIFCKKQMVLFKETFPNSRERFTKVNQMWKTLSYEDKNCFKQDVTENMKEYSMELQKWFKTLSRAQQESYRTKNPSKWQYLGENCTKEPFAYRPSDSEDEIFEDCDSEQEWKMFDFEEV
ncbi:hypothetical protein F7725_014286 [Dissostichus mawsoni]|uniref:HMG box domain-containing protein n=1 Tax=Dissostichus mawsoni TaxID=36200 RepID=A0A7J5YZU5_DISMA|nr:hypothetical protein F7725_014286 [Dissostichus mawsoni]